MKIQGLGKWFLVFCLVLMGCSGNSESGETITEAESVYSPGASVSATSYGDAYGITVSVLDAQGNFIPVYDGDYVAPGVHTFGVQVEGDPANIDRVFFSDGGTYQVEASMQDGLYVSGFDVSEENLYQNILVQVIHNNSLASKEKVVLRTFEHDRGKRYVKNGAALLIAQEILDGQRGALSEYLDSVISDVFLHIPEQTEGVFDKLGYGDDDPDTVDIDVLSIEATHSDEYPEAVIHVACVVEDVDISAIPLYGQSLICSDDNDLAIDLYLVADDEGEDGSIRFILDFMDSVQVGFEKDFFMKDVVEDMIVSGLTKIDLPPLVRDLSGLDDGIPADLSEHLLVFGKEIDLNPLSDRLITNLNNYLFADVYGIPEKTGSEELCLGIGFFAGEYDDLVWESYGDSSMTSQPFDAEGKIEDLFEDGIEAAFESLRQEYEGLVTELSYGDDDPETADFIINSFVIEDTADENVKSLGINYTIKDVDFAAVSLFGFDLVSTRDNDLTIDSIMTMEYRTTGSEDVLAFNVSEILDVAFADYFLGKEVVEDMIKTDLAEMEETATAVKDFTQDINLSVDVAEVLFSGCEVPRFPDVEPYSVSPSWELVMPESCNAACAISQDNINRIMESVLKEGSQWDMKKLLTSFLEENYEGFGSDAAADSETIMRLSVPPVLDVRTSRMRLLLNDLVVQYRIAGEPQWEASVDLNFIVGACARNGRLDISLSQIPEETHFHIMRDNPGNLGIFDHTTLAADVIDRLPEILGGSSEDATISLSLDVFSPAIVFKEVPAPALISAGGGYLYVDMAVSELKLTTASLWETRCE